jgi:hypothetical protein
VLLRLFRNDKDFKVAEKSVADIRNDSLRTIITERLKHRKPPAEKSDVGYTAALLNDSFSGFAVVC